MTFACLSQATATSNRVFHHSQNTINRIQNTFITDEIHDQGKKFISDVKFQGKLLIILNENRVIHTNHISADSSFCWAFALSTMIRHSVHYFLGQLAMERPMRFHTDKICEATTFLNGLEFHKRLRIGSNRS